MQTGSPTVTSSSCSINTSPSQAVCQVNYQTDSNDRPVIVLEIFLGNANTVFADTPSGVTPPNGITMVDSGGDPLLTGAYGRSRLLKNTLPTTGRAEFVDVSDQVGLTDHCTSVAATFFDFDRDGRVDLYIANSLPAYLPGYAQPTPLNIFDLPKPAFDGDRRMLHFMHESWNNASNGGVNLLFHNDGARFKAKND